MELVTPTRRDSLAVVARIGLLLLVIIAAAFLVWPAGPILVGVAGVIPLIRWHARTFGHRCTRCTHEFTLSAWQDALAINWISEGHPARYVRCPVCGQRGLMRVLTVRR